MTPTDSVLLALERGTRHHERAIAATQIAILRNAVECLIMGACAVGVPHAAEREVLKDAVQIGRKALADVPQPVASL